MSESHPEIEVPDEDEWAPDASPYDNHDGKQDPSAAAEDES